MTIEGAVKLYKERQERISQINLLIRRIFDNNYGFPRLPGEYVLYQKDMEEIGGYLKELKERLETDLKQDFNLD